MQGTYYTHWLIVKPNRLRGGNPTANLYINIPPGIFFEGAGDDKNFFSRHFFRIETNRIGVQDGRRTRCGSRASTGPPSYRRPWSSEQSSERGRRSGNFLPCLSYNAPPPTQAKTRRPQADKDPSPFIIISLFFYEHKIFHSIFLNNRAWMISVTPSFADPLHFDMDPQIHFVKRFVK